MILSASSPAPFARVVGAVLGLAALVVALVATASPAAAHARLESSSPADGSTLTAVPPEVMLRFNEPIKDGLNEVTVKSGSTNVAEGSVQVEGSTVYQPVKYSMKPGNYSISYKVVSADGHPVSGTVSFTYDPPEGDTGAGEEPGATSTSSGTDGEAPSSTSSSAAAPSSSGDGSSSAGTSSSPTESGSPSESATSTSGTSEPTSTSTSPSETASTSPQSSESSSPSDEAVADPDETSGDGDDMSPWWFAIGAAVLVIILAVIAMLVRGRKRSDSDEDATLEEWRG